MAQPMSAQAQRAYQTSRQASKQACMLEHRASAASTYIYIYIQCSVCAAVVPF